jgi:replicative DNA helicase
MANNDTKDLIELEKKLFTYEGQDRVMSSHDMAQALREEDQPILIKSGFPTVDLLTGGFQGGDLTIPSGITGHGKTLLCVTITRNFFAQGIYSLWLSFEVMSANFLKLFGDDLPLFYMPARLTENSLNWIETRVHEAKLKYGIKAVFIDHLHFIVSMNRSNISIEIGQTMRAIKKMALKFNVCFFLIAHTQKIKPDIELGLGDTRDSSFIEQEADNVFYIWRTKKERQAILKIAKNRRNGVFDKKITLYKVGNFLEELPNV